MLTLREIQIVENAISMVVDMFRRSPNVFLTEEDVRFHICHYLLPHFGRETGTADDDRSISLHSEVRWYGRDGNLALRSDVVLIDVSELRVLRYLTMPSKGYGFNIPKAIIEIKLRRPNGESNRAFRDRIAEDIRKMRKLQRAVCNATGSHNCTTRFWLIAFDKKSQLRIGRFPGLTFIYEHALHMQRQA